MAEMGVALWNRHLRHNPTDPKWANRDRFVLSNGHASMLLYSVLHLTGYDLSLDDIKNSANWAPAKRQGTRSTAIHPASNHHRPDRAGAGQCRGLALAEKLLAIEFNRNGLPIVDHHTYAFVGDGCLMEGISHEVCSLAGTWQLGKLIVLWDDNDISIDGRVSGWFTDDTPKVSTRMLECHSQRRWPRCRRTRSGDPEGKSQSENPRSSVARRSSGKGSPNREDTPGIHGNPLGDEEIAAARAAMGITAGPFENRR